MVKILAFITLFISYLIYSGFVYSIGTESTVIPNKEEQLTVTKGKALYEKYNCVSCHQLYGLGGYLGPELTTAYSDPQRGELFMKALLQAGGRRMPNFHFNENEISAIITYLKYVDATAVSYKKK